MPQIFHLLRVLRLHMVNLLLDFIHIDISRNAFFLPFPDNDVSFFVDCGWCSDFLYHAAFKPVNIGIDANSIHILDSLGRRLDFRWISHPTLQIWELFLNFWIFFSKDQRFLLGIISHAGLRPKLGNAHAWYFELGLVFLARVFAISYFVPFHSQG